ncbi:MAG: hypothetical protein ACTHZ9_03355 [Leucobacter sp.]
MISTPYKQLRELLGMPDEWYPEWAERLEVRRIGGATHYYASPERLTTDDLAELHELITAGWGVAIDGPRLGRVRIEILEDHRGN